MKRIMAIASLSFLLLALAGAHGDDEKGKGKPQEGADDVLAELSPEKLLPPQVNEKVKEIIKTSIEANTKPDNPTRRPEVQERIKTEMLKVVVRMPEEKQREFVRDVMKDEPKSKWDQEKFDREWKPATRRPAQNAAPDRESRPYQFDSNAFNQLRQMNETSVQGAHSPSDTGARSSAGRTVDGTRATVPVTNVREHVNERAKTYQAVTDQVQRRGGEIRKDSNNILYYQGPKDSSMGRTIVNDLKNVGGVNLDVAVDFLESLDVPGVRTSDPLVGIENPVLVSMTKLLKTRPAKLPVGRIHGFVLTERDIYLVGVKSDPAIDFDCLVIALKSVFREGGTPGVSLDPKPDDMGGPQYSRVIGVPFESEFAKIMLDADYLMKRINLGLEQVPTAQRNGFRCKWDMFVQQARNGGAGGRSTNRFWFYPVRLEERDIRASWDGSAIVFHTGVQLLTEQMIQVEDRLAGTNEQDPLARESAEIFTRHYAEMEQDKPVFRQLHSLVDLVTLCRIWRRMGLSSKILDDLAGLSIKRVHVTPSYAGLTRKTTVGNWELTVCGGVKARARMTHRAFDAYPSAQLARLRAALNGADDLAIEWKGTLMAPQAQAHNEGRLESLVDSALGEIARGNFKKALEILDKARSLDPTYAEIDHWRAVAYVALNRHAEAVEAARAAVAKDSGDPDLKEFKIMIEISYGELTASPGEDTRNASRTFSDHGYGCLQEKKPSLDQAIKCFTKAVELWDENADAWIGRAIVRQQRRDMKGALEDLMQARRILKRKGGEDQQLAKVLAMSAADRAALIKFDQLQSPEDLQAAATEITRAAADAKEAVELDPDLWLARYVAIMTRAMKVVCINGKWDGVEKDAAAFVKEHPELGLSHLAQGFMWTLRQRPAEALAALDRAVDADPLCVEAYLLRALIRYDQKEWKKAASDFEEAASLSPEMAAMYKAQMEDCRRHAGK